MQDISVEELARWRASGKAFVLLDVREPFELEAASLPGVLHIPMRQIPQRAGEIDREAEIAVLCHHGGRSERVAQFLAMQGFLKVRNVAGGIDAYAKRVDDSIPRY
ncbi:MAG TPA: rhodanese-like domain-containing protein [Candidatus Baltobacteraceae bacterium]|nr:rhodanese-like domain-containing protein [Candidatus Baltobacteraceae bacterium]